AQDAQPLHEAPLDLHAAADRRGPHGLQQFLGAAEVQDVLAGLLLAVGLDLDPVLALGRQHADGLAGALAGLLLALFALAVLALLFPLLAAGGLQALDAHDAAPFRDPPLQPHAAAAREGFDGVAHLLVRPAALVWGAAAPVRHVLAGLLLAVGL